MPSATCTPRHRAHPTPAASAVQRAVGRRRSACGDLGRTTCACGRPGEARSGVSSVSGVGRVGRVGPVGRVGRVGCRACRACRACRVSGVSGVSGLSGLSPPAHDGQAAQIPDRRWRNYRRGRVPWLDAYQERQPTTPPPRSRWASGVGCDLDQLHQRRPHGALLRGMARVHEGLMVGAVTPSGEARLRLLVAVVGGGHLLRRDPRVLGGTRRRSRGAGPDLYEGRWRPGPRDRRRSHDRALAR
jgi:hypothetical protein